MTTPTNEPTELRAGLTWDWRREDLSADYPANGGWSLKYWFKKTGATPGNFSIDASADGAYFAVTVAAATTAAYVAGDYTWAAQATKGAEIREVDSGRMKILPRYDQAANVDDRTIARRTLEAIDALIENRASKDQEEYQIAGRSLKRIPIAELLKFRQFYAAQVATEEAAAAIAAGSGIGRKIQVRL